MKHACATLLFLLPALVPAAASAETPAERHAAAEALVARLSAEKFADREDAMRKLIAIGPDAFVVVMKALDQSDDPEVRTRCKTVLKNLRLVERVVADLGPYPDPWEGARTFQSESCDVLGHVVEEGRKSQLIINGKAAAVHARIGNVSLSREGGHYAYEAEDERGKSFVVRDGVKGPTYASIRGWPLFSPDGKHVAYAAQRADGKHVAVLDGKEGCAYDDVRLPLDWVGGEHLAYVAQSGLETFLVIDGVESAPYAGVVLPRLGPPNRYVVEVDRELWSMEADPPARGAAAERLTERRLKLLAKPAALDPRSATFLTADGAHLYVRSADRGVISHNGEPIDGSSDWVIPSNVKHVAVLARGAAAGAGACRVVIDGTAGAACDDIENATFSEDGEVLAYAARRDGKRFVVWNGKEGRGFMRILSSLSLSRDGRHLAYLAASEREVFVVLDDEARPMPFPTFKVEISPDGRRVLSVESADGRSRLVVDGLKSAGYDSIPDAWFSCDSRHVRFVAARGGREFMVCDGFEGPPHDAIRQAGRRNETATSFRYFIVEGGRKYLVESDFPADPNPTHGVE